MSNLISAVLCLVCLAIANFGVEAFHTVPDYMNAAKVTWNQTWAIGIYYFIWVKD